MFYHHHQCGGAHLFLQSHLVTGGFVFPNSVLFYIIQTWGETGGFELLA